MEKKAWSFNFSLMGEREWDRLDGSVQKKIINFLTQRLQREEDPRVFTKPLEGNLKHFWRYRVEDYRLICAFNEKEKVILIMRIAHRREVYKHLHFSLPISWSKRE